MSVISICDQNSGDKIQNLENPENFTIGYKAQLILLYIMIK